MFLYPLDSPLRHVTPFQSCDTQKCSETAHPPSTYKSAVWEYSITIHRNRGTEPWLKNPIMNWNVAQKSRYELNHDMDVSLHPDYVNKTLFM